MPLGKASIKRATGALEKGEAKAEKKEKVPFSAVSVLTQAALSEICVPESKECVPDASLVRSVKKYGVICPVFAVRKGEELALVSGFARFAAAKEAGLASIPVIVCEISGTGAAAAVKDLQSTKKVCAAPEVAKKAEASSEAEKAPEKESDSIHEEKFKVIRSVRLGDSMPEFLL